MTDESIVCVIAARNEEEWLDRTLTSVRKQTKQVDDIVLINDGSTDDTPLIAEKHGCTIVDLPYHEESYIGKPEKMAWIWNQGLKEARGHHPDKLLLMGADTVIPPDYLDKITRRMNNGVVITSGRLENEFYAFHAPRGTGRVVDTEFWMEANNLQYPLQPGWESWIKYKALQQGYKMRCYPDIVVKTRPVHRSHGKGYSHGKAMAVCGYWTPKALGRITKQMMNNPRFGLALLAGYLRGLLMPRTDLADFLTRRQKQKVQDSISYWRHHLKVLSSFHTGRTQLDYHPMISSIELTNRCNLNCTFCAREEVREHRGYGDMPYQEYRHILERYPECIRNLRLFQHGEPTLYPRMADAIQDAHELADVSSVGFTTNGNFPTSKLREYYEAGITGICFSLDGFKEEYERVRMGGDHNLVELNIMETHRLRERYPDVGVTINIVETEHTRPRLEEFVEYWSRYVDRVKVGQLHDWGGETALDSELGYIDPEQPPNCLTPYHTVKIHYNGGIAPCCSWLEEPMGNIFNDNLLEVWNNRRYQELRRSLSEHRSLHPKCRDCYVRTGWGKWNDLHERNPWFPLDRQYLSLLMRPVQRVFGRLKKYDEKRYEKNRNE